MRINFKFWKRKFKNRLKRESKIDTNSNQIPQINVYKGINKINRSSFKKRKVKTIVRKVGSRVIINKLVYILLTILLLIGIGLFVSYFFFSSKYKIQTIEITGNSSLSTTFFNEKLSYLKGKNVFLVRSSSLEREIGKFSTYIETVDVKKDLPNKIIIEVVERKPIYLWINFSEAVLVSDKGYVLEIINDYEDFTPTDKELDLIKGYYNLKEFQSSQNENEENEANLTQPETENQNSSTDKPETEEEELTQEEINSLIEKQRLEAVTRIETYFTTVKTDIPESYKVYTLISNYDNRSYKLLDQIDKSSIDLTNAILKIDFLGENVVKYVWESPYRFVIYFNQQRQILFSTRRPIDDQINDLRLLLEDLKLKGKSFKVIDLSSEVVMYQDDQ